MGKILGIFLVSPIKDYVSLLNGKKIYQVQEKISWSDKIRVFAIRGIYYIYLKYQYILDKYQYAHLKKRVHSGFTSRKCSDAVENWKHELKRMQTALDLFRFNLPLQKVVQNSEKILRHRFSILGRSFGHIDSRGGACLGYQPVPWLRDPVSGYEWSKGTWYRDIRKNVPSGVDIKFPWELSRCQHFTLLGEAYNLTKDERYAAEYRNQIIDWIASNPVRYGPNWACTMDVGIRIANWMISLLYFVNSPELDNRFYGTLLESAWEHGNHIKRNLENMAPFTSNHYMGNISGLYVLAVLCPILRSSKKWKAFAKKELEKEIFRQTFEDGWSFESSTCYHRLVTEMLLYAFVLAESIGEPFSDAFAGRLKQMIRVLAECTKPDGNIPQIGDNDSGRFLVFNLERGFDDLDVRYLIDTAARNSRIKPDLHDNQSVCYPDSGRYLFRSPSLYLLVTAGPKGQAGRGGHAHNDVLSYVLNANGEDVIVDPGTYVYTPDPDARNRFRSVLSHNTLCWEGIEPCSFEKGLFLLPEEGVLKVDECSIGQSRERFSAVYEYSGRFHRREILFNKDDEKISIKDVLSHDGAMLSFVCAPGIDSILERTGFCAGRVLFHFDKVKSIDIIRSQYSPGYGKVWPNKLIRVHLAGKTCIHRIELMD